ncbi:MAG: Rha family transcriptional regulator, partial [Alistipes sp.]|nr:Rha family transcriptional regulator [Alistipes sp.]
MSSLQIAEVTGKRHCDVLEAIHNMEPAWEKVNGRKFALVEFKDAKGEMRPMYQLNKTECLYIATKFNDEARAKLVIRWEELERIHTTGGFQAPQSYAEALRQLADTIDTRTAGQGELLQPQSPIPSPIKSRGSTAVPTAYPCKISTLAR